MIKKVTVPSQLDVIRGREAFNAYRKVYPGLSAFDGQGDLRDAFILAAQLGREGWVPVDPDLIAARRLVAEWWRENRPTYPNRPDIIMRGEWDNEPEVTQALAAIKIGRELAEKES